jgi:hypothetical protein
MWLNSSNVSVLGWWIVAMTVQFSLRARLHTLLITAPAATESRPEVGSSKEKAYINIISLKK